MDFNVCSTEIRVNMEKSHPWIMTIMKNFNRRSAVPMVTKAQSSANWRNTHSCGLHSFTHALTTQLHLHLQPLCVKRQFSYYRIWNHILFENTRGRVSKPEYPEKTPDSLPANWYHILGENTSRMGIRTLIAHPPTLVISSFGQEHAPHLTHWATDRRLVGWFSQSLPLISVAVGPQAGEGLEFDW